jgi:LPS-assembly protein
MNNYSYVRGKNEYMGVTNLKKSISFKLSQYLIASNWKIDHEISEVYYIDDNNQTSNYSDLQNDLSIKYFDYYLKDVNKFSIDDNKINYNSVTIGYNDSIKKLEFSHIYQREYDSYSKSESVDVKGYYKFDNIHKLFGEYNYDLALDMQKYYILGINMQKKCWHYSISYKKETVPLLTNNGISSIIQKTIYFEIELIPLGGFKQQYQFKTKKAEG